MGYAIVIGRCICCKGLICFNPNTVPSTSAITGQREPICLDCVNRINPVRVANGLDPIVPAQDAYEPCQEEELS